MLVGWPLAVRRLRCHGGTPLADLRLTPDTIHHRTSLALELAACHGSGRLVSLLEGGYDLANLAAHGAAPDNEVIGMTLIQGRFAPALLELARDLEARP